MAIVDILLASYNGEKYIETQLLSLIWQTFRDWRLLIHDDGSKDATVDIIKKWSLIDNRIHLIEDTIICGGAAKNFMHLLSFVDAEYIMFCDQDDIWFDNKIEVMVEAIQKKEKSVSHVVYSNSYVWKSDKGILGKGALAFPKKIEQFLFLNGGMLGCMAIFNRTMCFNLLRWKGNCAMHDHLLHLAGISFGEVEYLSLSLMLYRKHQNNVTGGDYLKINDYRKITKNHKKPVVDKRHYDTVKRFYLLYKGIINTQKLRKIKLFLLLPRIKKIKRFGLIVLGGFQIYNSRLRLIIKLIIRPYIGII